MAPNPKSKKQAEKRLPSLAADPPPPQWVIDLRSDRPTTETTLVTECWWDDPDWDLHIVERIVRDVETGQLRDFAVSIEAQSTGEDEGWVLIERVDCDHDRVHVDRGRRDGKKEKDWNGVPSDVHEDLDKALAWALKYIWDIEERMGAWS